MKLAIPSPTYPAVKVPFGPSTLSNLTLLQPIELGIAPDNDFIKELVTKASKSILLKSNTINPRYFKTGQELEDYEAQNENLTFGLVFTEWTNDVSIL